MSGSQRILGWSTLILLAASCLASASTPSRESDQAFQQSVVAALSDATDSGLLGPRSTHEQRAAAADWLAGRIEGLGLIAQRHEYRRRNVNPLVDLLLSPYQGSNVFSVLEADTKPARYVIIGAHYDSVPDSPGAIDNASGVALVLSLARSLSSQSPRHFHFAFVLFDQEEDDEVGSRAFADWIARQGWDVHSVHVADLVGWDADGDRAVEVQSPGPMLERHYRRAADRLGIPLHITRGASSDNRSFLEAGYPTAGVWEEWDHDDSTPYLHSPKDRFETVDPGYLSSTTGLVLEVLMHLHQGAGDAD